MSSVTPGETTDEATAVDTDAEPTSGARREDAEVLTGARKYTGDFSPADTVHAAVYRSPYAHANIIDIDMSAALALDGVLGGFTGETLPGYVLPLTWGRGFTPDPGDQHQEKNPRTNSFGHYCLAREKVRFVGEPVGVVVAEDRYTAEDAVGLIRAKYEQLDPVVDELTALEPDSPLLYEEWGHNRLLEFDIEHGDVDAAFAEADHVIEEELRHHRFTGTPMEPRAVLAHYDPTDQYVQMYASVQKPHNIASHVENSLDIPALKVDVNAENIGGGFGIKTGYYPEAQLVPVLAIEFGRPVKWTELRREHLVASVHAREQTHRVKIGVNDDGRILGLADEIIANSGAAYPHAAIPAHITTSQFIPGTYDIQNFRCRMVGVVTNKAPFGAHRGFGKAEAAFVIERVAKIVADALDIDPAEFRYRNFIQPDQFPYVSATGSTYDSGNYPEALRRALELVEYDRWRERQAQRRSEENTRLLGIGIGVCVEPSSAAREGAAATPGYYAVRIRIDTGGQVYVFPEDPDLGTSHETSILTIISEELEVDPATVKVIQGDTRACPYGSGSYSSRFSVVGTTACYEAAHRMLDRMKRIAAHQFDESPDALAVHHGRLHTPAGDSLSFREIADLAYHRLDKLPGGMDPGLDLLHYTRAPNIDYDVPGTGRMNNFSAHPYTADIAVIDLDPATGLFEILEYVSVHDCGNILNEKIVEGQHLGALAHGFGGALLEELPYDENGQPLHQTFIDYLVPSANEIPEVTLDHTVTPTPFTPGGYKGSGETGTVSPPPVLTNAVEDALAPFGVKIREPSPMKPDFIWQKIHGRHDTDP